MVVICCSEYTTFELVSICGALVVIVGIAALVIVFTVTGPLPPLLTLVIKWCVPGYAAESLEFDVAGIWVILISGRVGVCGMCCDIVCDDCWIWVW